MAGVFISNKRGNLIGVNIVPIQLPYIQNEGFFACLDYIAQQTHYDQTYPPDKEQQSKNIAPITNRGNKNYSDDHTQNTYNYRP
jgi:hypothetical protein